MNTENNYPSSLRRAAAATIDIWIVLMLRVILMQFLGSVWLNSAIAEFLIEFENKFGTKVIKDTSEHLNFIIHHKVFIYTLLFYVIIIMVGAVYHAYLNSSKWQATVGKRAMKILVVNSSNKNPISLAKGFAHYALSVAPFAYVMYIASYKLRYDITFFEAIMRNEANILFGIIFVLWIQIHAFLKKKTTIYDLICKVIFINGKTESKKPWKK
jgi:uncharacterized RDD family membrane protein YckC